MTPRVNEKQLKTGAAVAAECFRDESGCIQPYMRYGSYIIPTTVAYTFVVWPTSDEREWPPGDNDSYIYWGSRVDYCMGVNNGYSSILYADGGYPKKADPKVTPLQPVKLGIEPPTRAVDLEIYTYETESEIENSISAVSYCYTFVDNQGQESAPSPPSVVLDISKIENGKGVRLSGFASPSAGNNPVPQLRIYRAEAGASGDAEFLFIGETGTTVPFDDYSLSTHTLLAAGEAITVTDWHPPPPDLAGLTSFYGGVLAGFRKATNELCFSEPLVQYAWPEKYRLTMPQPILDIAPLGEELVVFMPSIIMAVRGEPGLMSVSEVYGGGGTVSVTGCGVIRMDSGILYPGHDGLYLYNGASCVNITANTLTTLQWRSFLPDNFISAYYDGRYWGFTEDSAKAVAINISDGSFINIDLGKSDAGSSMTIKGVHVDYHGRLWLQTWANIYPWNEAAAPMTATWKSGIIQMSSPVNLAAAFIDGKTPDTDAEKIESLKIWSHYRGVETLVFDSVVAGLQIPINSPFRLPGGFLTSAVQIEIKTTAVIRGVRLATSMSELGA